jgi:hypothetical protein
LARRSPQLGLAGLSAVKVLSVHQQQLLKIFEKSFGQFRRMAMGCKVHDYLPLIGNVPLALANVPFGHFQQRLGHTRKTTGTPLLFQCPFALGAHRIRAQKL